VPQPSVLRLRVLIFPSFLCNLDPQYRCGIISPVDTAPRLQPGVSVLSAGILAGSSQSANPKNSTLRRLYVSLRSQGPGPCASSRSRMAAVAAPLAPAKIPISASTTPKKKPAPTLLNAQQRLATSSPRLPLPCDLSTPSAASSPPLSARCKPKIARTVAYMAQTLLQTMHIPRRVHQHVRHGRLGGKIHSQLRQRQPQLPLPPAPKREQQMDQAPHVVAGLRPVGRSSKPAPAAQPVSQPAPPPYTSLPRTSAEFFQRVVAGRNLSRPGRENRFLVGHSACPTSPTHPKPAETPKAPSVRPQPPATAPPLHRGPHPLAFPPQ